MKVARSQRGGRSQRGDSPDRENLERSLQKGGAAIQAAYNADYDRMGQRFAMGDSELFSLRPWKGLANLSQ